jgi:hypothetical protein
VPAQQFPTPYITPEILTNASTGISWNTIPARNSTPAQQVAEQWNICRRATAMVDVEINQTLRATYSTETFLCPDYRVTQLSGPGTAYILLSRKPILGVVSGQIAFNNPPLQFTSIPGTSFFVNQPTPGNFGSSIPGDAAESGQSITMGTGFLSWANGRKGQVLQVTYLSGYPHTSLTSVAAGGSMTLTVDDCTGWGPLAGGALGASGRIDDAGNEETFNVASASVTEGPGTLTLSSALQFTHGQGTVVTSIPSQLIQASILFAVSQALVRGATATGVPSMSGGIIHGDSPAAYASEAELMCKPYRRTT